MVNRCFVCNRSLGTVKKEDSSLEKCVECQDVHRMEMIVDGLPEPHESGWEKLTEWEALFTADMKKRFDHGHTKVSDKQREILERIWRKCDA